KARDTTGESCPTPQVSCRVGSHLPSPSIAACPAQEPGRPPVAPRSRPRNQACPLRLGAAFEPEILEKPPKTRAKLQARVAVRVHHSVPDKRLCARARSPL